MAAVVNIISRCDLSVDVYRTNQPNKMKANAVQAVISQLQSFKTVVHT